MKPQFERVTFPAGCSIRVYHRQIAEIPFEWHHHPEYELTLTLNSRGWRFVGDHIGAYTARDLVLVPPDMPHTWASTSALDEARPHSAVVVWFTGGWALKLAEVCPEFGALRSLLKSAGAGLSFPASAGAALEARLGDLLSESPGGRLRTVLDVLTELASLEAVPLATAHAALRSAPEQPAQLNRILDLLHKRFTEPVRVDELCAAGNLSARSLHRLFLRHVGENVSDYLSRLRMGRASMLLVETDSPISMIAAEAGFTNLANFNRRFRELRRMTPREFRGYYVKHGRMPTAMSEADLTKRPHSLEAGQKSRSHRQAAG
jgi:AraC-like DNA-binding protein